MFRKIIKLLFLYPLSRIWVGIHRLRRFCYTGLLCHSYLAPIPVISIWNLSFGGTGKTPLMHKIASWLQEWKLN
ncbi:MAG: tetraacyldisaccharide 4'-kinase, partial [Bacteriovoracaceae bacterium]|nr:tetraacyldisaccharide 4'-kinase [Bacteriovoracaceae bacterium]